MVQREESVRKVGVVGTGAQVSEASTGAPSSGDTLLPSRCGSQITTETRLAGTKEGPEPCLSPSPTPRLESCLPSEAGRRRPQGSTPCPDQASSRDPRPRTVPLALTESFNELGEDPGVAFHEAPLPSISRHGPGHTPPRSTSGSGTPQIQPPPATELCKPAVGSSTSRHPAYFPTASGRRHLQRDRAREDALSTQETAKLFLGRAGPGADSEGPGPPRKGGIWGAGGGNIRDSRQSGAGAGHAQGGGARSREPNRETRAAESQQAPPLRLTRVVFRRRGAALLPVARRLRRIGRRAQVRTPRAAGWPGPFVRSERRLGPAGPPWPSPRIPAAEAGADAAPTSLPPRLRALPSWVVRPTPLLSRALPEAGIAPAYTCGASRRPASQGPAFLLPLLLLLLFLLPPLLRREALPGLWASGRRIFVRRPRTKFVLEGMTRDRRRSVLSSVGLIDKCKGARCLQGT